MINNICVYLKIVTMVEISESEAWHHIFTCVDDIGDDRLIVDVTPAILDQGYFFRFNILLCDFSDLFKHLI